MLFQWTRYFQECARVDWIRSNHSHMGMRRCGLPVFNAQLFVLVSVLAREILSLKLVALDIPKIVQPGQSVSLICIYDLQGDGLYSVKWYRDDMEFFRFVPSDKPPGQFFPIAGVNIDLERSGNGTVHIVEVNSGTTGTYRCEVSAEAPSFQTVQAEKMMTVHSPNNGSIRQHRHITWNVVLILLLLNLFMSSFLV